MRSRSRCQGERVGDSGSGMEPAAAGRRLHGVPGQCHGRGDYTGACRGFNRCAGAAVPRQGWGCRQNRQPAPRHATSSIPHFNSSAFHPIFPSMNQFAVTERAASRIAEIVAAEGRDAALRVAVLAGGCSGFQYKFELDDAAQPDDLIIECDRGEGGGGPGQPGTAGRRRAGLFRRADGQLLRGAQPERQVGLRLRHQLLGGLNRGGSPAPQLPGPGD